VAPHCMTMQDNGRMGWKQNVKEWPQSMVITSIIANQDRNIACWYEMKSLVWMDSSLQRKLDARGPGERSWYYFYNFDQNVLATRPWAKNRFIMYGRELPVAGMCTSRVATNHARSGKISLSCGKVILLVHTYKHVCQTFAAFPIRAIHKGLKVLQSI
jgi:hypothetical protein